MIRSFIGLPLPPAAVRALENLQGGLPQARAVPAENMHLTLAFLHDQPERVLRALVEELDTINAAPIDIRLADFLLLGGKEPGAITVKADGGEALIRLQSRVAHLVREADIDLPRRRFRPHVTIFRLSRGVEKTETARIQDWITAASGFEPVHFTCTSMVLYRSRLAKHGAVYDPLAVVNFAGRDI